MARAKHVWTIVMGVGLFFSASVQAQPGPDGDDVPSDPTPDNAEGEPGRLGERIQIAIDHLNANLGNDQETVQINLRLAPPKDPKDQNGDPATADQPLIEVILPAEWGGEPDRSVKIDTGLLAVLLVAVGLAEYLAGVRRRLISRRREIKDQRHEWIYQYLASSEMRESPEARHVLIERIYESLKQDSSHRWRLLSLVLPDVVVLMALVLLSCLFLHDWFVGSWLTWFAGGAIAAGAIVLVAMHLFQDVFSVVKWWTGKNPKKLGQASSQSDRESAAVEGYITGAFHSDVKDALFPTSPPASASGAGQGAEAEAAGGSSG